MMQTKPIATRESYGRTLAQLGAENNKVVVLDADLACLLYTSPSPRD